MFGRIILFAAVMFLFYMAADNLHKKKDHFKKWSKEVNISE